MIEIQMRFLKVGTKKRKNRYAFTLTETVKGGSYTSTSRFLYHTRHSALVAGRKRGQAWQDDN